jgi:hypothetical protein
VQLAEQSKMEFDSRLGVIKLSKKNLEISQEAKRLIMESCNHIREWLF